MRRILDAMPKARIAATVAALALGGCVSNGYPYEDPARAVYSGGGGYYAPGSYYSGGNYYYPYGPQGYYVGNRWVSRPLYYNHVHHGDHCDHASHHGHDNDDHDSDDDDHDSDGHDHEGQDGQNYADGRGRDYLDRRGDAQHRDRARSDGTHAQGAVIPNGQPAQRNVGIGRDYPGARGENSRNGGRPQLPVSSNRSGDVKPPPRVAAPQEARVRQPSPATPKAPLGREGCKGNGCGAPDTTRSDSTNARDRP